MIEPKLVTEELDFGREVLGETIIKNIKIINEGQLSGQFKLSRVFKCRSLIGWDDQRIRIILKTGIRIESDEFDEDDSDEIIMTQVGFQMDSRCLIRQPISADLVKPFEHNENQVYEFPSNTEIQIPVQFNPNVPGDLRLARNFFEKICQSEASILDWNFEQEKSKIVHIKIVKKFDISSWEVIEHQHSFSVPIRVVFKEIIWNSMKIDFSNMEIWTKNIWKQ